MTEEQADIVLKIFELSVEVSGDDHWKEILMNTEIRREDIYDAFEALSEMSGGSNPVSFFDLNG